MSDAQDVAAIAAYLKPASAQVSAFVAFVTDQAAKDAWYALSTRILHFVSGDYVVTRLSDARALRAEFDAMVQTLSPSGTLAARIAAAPPQVVAPPPQGTPNPLFGWLQGAESVLPFVLLGLVLFEMEGRR